MDTPICDFVTNYCSSNPLRLHMPGHKGISFLGMENLDITEIEGADSLFDADGIIRQSEENASSVFGCRTFYSTEGSSLCIRAMLYLCMLYAKQQKRTPLIAAARNIHSTFIRAAAMLDFDIHWLYSSRRSSYLNCVIDPQDLDQWLNDVSSKPVAVYLTSPDYLGNVANIFEISKVCHKHDVLLLVDNAHGAYLRFLPISAHPIDLGADICCDSAHKTLPVLTGGAYLHISDHAPELFSDMAKQAMAMFASTSPSYLILQSLDSVNPYLNNEYRNKLASFLPLCLTLMKQLNNHGYTLIGDEPLKLTVDCKAYGYTGLALAQKLRKQNIFVEFCDPDYLVLMLTPEIEPNGLNRVKDAMQQIPQRKTLSSPPPFPCPCKQILTPRRACFSPSQIIPVENSIGRIIASSTVGCPPAVPIITCGEEIDANTIACFTYYGVKTCCVTIE